MTNDHPADHMRLPVVPLLITESEQEFNGIRDALYEEISPDGIIERIYVDEIVDIIWQIIRLKRCKAGVTNLAFHDASAKILYHLMQAGPEIAREWISNPKIAKKVDAELATYKLDGSVIMRNASRKKVVPKRRGRPPTGRDPVSAIRLSHALKSKIDNWAMQQPDSPSRSEAIRRLVEVGLATQLGKRKPSKRRPTT